MRIVSIFRKAGDILGLDLEYFVKNQVILSIATSSSIISGFILSILLANFVDKTTFGQYSLVLSIVTTLGFTGIYGLRSLLPFVISKGRDGFYNQALQFSFLGSLVGSFFLLGTGIYYLQPDKPELFKTFLLTAIIFPLSNSLVFYQGVLTGKKLFLRQSLYSIVKSIIPALAIALVVFIKPETFWLVFVGLVSQTFLDVIFTKKTLELLRNTKKSNKDLRYGLKLSGIWLLPMATANLDKILIAKMLGFEALAIYTFSFLIPQQISNFLKNLQPLAISKMTSLSSDSIKIDLPKKAFQLSLFILPIVLLYIIAAPIIFNTIYPNYKESIAYTQLYSIGILAFPATILTQSFHHLRQINNSFKFTLSTVFVKLSVVLTLVYFFGLTGAALAFVLNSFFEYFVAFYLVKNS